MSKTRDRYFIVNRWRGKGGHLRAGATEMRSHLSAMLGAKRLIDSLTYLAGECSDEFHVFVGSKTRLDQLLKADQEEVTYT